MCDSTNKKPIIQRGHRPIGVDQFAPEGETYYLTEADCLEPAEGWNAADDYYESDDDE